MGKPFACDKIDQRSICPRIPFPLLRQKLSKRVILLASQHQGSISSQLLGESITILVSNSEWLVSEDRWLFFSTKAPIIFQICCRPLEKDIFLNKQENQATERILCSSLQYSSWSSNTNVANLKLSLCISGEKLWDVGGHTQSFFCLNERQISKWENTRKNRVNSRVPRPWSSKNISDIVSPGLEENLQLLLK